MMRTVGILILLLAVGVTANAQRFVPGEVLIKLKDGTSTLSGHAFIGKMISEKAMSLKSTFGDHNLYHFSLKAGQDVLSAVEELKNDPQVEYVEPNYIFSKSDVADEDATMRIQKAQLEAYLTSTQSVQTKVDINTAEAWVMVEESSVEAPIVAVIDTGLDLNHYVFNDSGALWTNTGEIPNNNIDDDGNGFIDDVHGWNFYKNNNSPVDDDGHGTHVSGIILGATQDIFASTLSAAKIRIMPLKFLGPGGEGTTSDAIHAIYYAVDNGARILNNSWGGEDYSTALKEAVAYCYNHHGLFVAAAGNSASNNDTKAIYPANYDVPSVTSIAAVDDWEALARFSNYGVKSVHLAGPGVSILSTFPNDTFGYSSGTSMAAPFVSGVAALLLLESPDLNGYELKGLLFGNSKQSAALSGKISTGAVVNAGLAVQAATSLSASGWQPVYSYSAPEEKAEMGTGCGLVRAMNGSGGGGSWPMIGLLTLILVVPIIIWRVMRTAQKQKEPQQRRRYERFKIQSDVTVNVGGRELIGSVSSISLGGVQLNTDALLEKGGIVSMKISSPDGKEQIEVQGQIVWSEAQKHYGVQFADTRENVLGTITNWTKSLVRS